MMKNRRLAVAAILIGATALLNFLVPVPGDYEPQTDLMSRKIPFVIGDWESDRNLPVSEEAKRVLGTDDILHRFYFRPNDPNEVLLSLVFSPGHRHSMHPPEVCYQSQGYTLVGHTTTDLPHDAEATVLELTGNDGDTLVNYWFYSQGRETASYMMHQLHLVLNQVLFHTQPSVLLRISTRIANHDEEAAQARLTAFAEDAVPVLRENLPKSK
jgi:EpsI family protein